MSRQFQKANNQDNPNVAECNGLPPTSPFPISFSLLPPYPLPPYPISPIPTSPFSQIFLPFVRFPIACCTRVLHKTLLVRKRTNNVQGVPTTRHYFDLVTFATVGIFSCSSLHSTEQAISKRGFPWIAADIHLSLFSVGRVS